MITYEPSNFSTSLDKTDFLGNGSYASVRRCYHHKLGSVVVKCFALTGSEAAMTVSASNIQKEAEVLLRLSHENIIKFHGVTKWSSCYGLVLEEATGYNLEDLFIHKPIKDISWHLRQRIFHDISGGLDYLHHHNPRRSYIHGDLKLQNILLTDDLKAKLADFGAVTIAMASGTFSASIDIEPSKQKTVLYSPPELLNKPLMKRTCAMDVYSFGLIGYEIITRQRIFHGHGSLNNLQLIIQMIKEQGIKPDEEIIRETKSRLKNEKEIEVFSLLEKLVKKCWLTNPDDRPIISEVKRELESSTLKEMMEVEHLKKPKVEASFPRIPLHIYGPPFRSLSPTTAERLALSKRKAQSQFHLEALKRIKTEESASTSSSERELQIYSPAMSSDIADECSNESNLYFKKPQSRTSSTNVYQSGISDREQGSTAIETETFRTILQTIRKLEIAILHCSGIPGSGTSHIVRELRTRFPFVAEDNKLRKNLLVQHIQCKEQGHDVKEEFKKLAEKLQTVDLTSNEKCQEIIVNIDMGDMDQLVEVLLQANVPVLIVVEDPVSDKNKKLLQDFLLSLNQKSQSYQNGLPKHCYISSRYETDVLTNEESINMSIYVKEAVTGFTRKESLEYLKLPGKFKREDEIAAGKLHERFDGLPLGLQVAKGYCIDSRIGYKDYLNVIKDITITISKPEEDRILKEFGKCAQHTFQAIVKPFIPESETGNIELNWKILSCLAYLNFYRIPRSAIEYCSHVLRETKVSMSQNSAHVGQMMSKLFRHNMCTEIKHKEEIVFHEVVNNSFRFIEPLNSTPPFNPIEKAIEVMSGLVSKDMRKNVQSQKMYKLRRHLQTLLGHVETNKKDLFKDEQNCFMMKVLTSHLYETAATIMLNESPALFLDESEKYFKNALKFVSKDVSIKLESSTNMNYKKEAKAIVARSKDISKSLPEDFAIQYVSKLLLHFDQQEEQFLQSKCKEMGFKPIQNFHDSFLEKLSLLKELQKRKLFLSNDKYSPVFVAERIASILHSYSRLVLYTDPNSNQQADKWMKMTNLSKAIAIQCKAACNVPLLAERLSETGGYIPIVLKLKKTSRIEIQKALTLCKNRLSSEDESTMYENGILKEVFGPSKTSTRISLLKSITRFNARQVTSIKNKSKLEEADRYCDDLLDLAKENVFNISGGIMGFICCAKYYVARNNFEMSMECFKQFFDTAAINEFHLRFNIYCWAVYNYARAVIFFNSKAETHLQEAIRKCKKVLNDNEKRSNDIDEKVRSYLQKLETAKTSTG